ncbi:hypothetical protein Q6D67_18555 [Haliea sp. E1-2-M8]|uniref:hypothetical protein n=1 Tax=Haliea sp. E1-2-M8 TaxID=3064706 RepID=UPI002716EEA2|nr:hypothetical protein [Haliea sp. E1-2-M8]MDO8863697.1 hypothetical protein [Haliea sp. E1-2-M8]
MVEVRLHIFELLEGYIEKLDELDLAPGSFDVIVSNCVVNSATYRLFKLEGLETDCEDYGQAVVYRGTMPNCPHGFSLDSHHFIETGRVFPVCGCNQISPTSSIGKLNKVVPEHGSQFVSLSIPPIWILVGFLRIENATIHSS